MFLESSSSFDLIYLVETSDTTTQQQLDQIINLIRVQVSAYSLGDKTRIALVTYGASPSTILNFADGVTHGNVLKGLYSIKKLKGGPDLPKALNYVQDNVLKMVRSDKPTILSVFTTRNPPVTQEKLLKSAKEKLQSRQVKIVLTTLDKAGLTEPLTSLTNVDRGYIVPEDTDSLASVLPDSINAINRALGEYGLKYTTVFRCHKANILNQ